MAVQISVNKLRHDGVRCLFNADRLTKQQVVELLENGAERLFADKELICETSNARSYQIRVGATILFAKEYKPRKLYKRLMDLVVPACHLSFKAGIRVLKSNLPTPTPIIAAQVQHNGTSRQILVTDFCQDSIGLDQKMKSAKPHMRRIVIDELAHLLADFHRKGFYSRHLRSANILVSEHRSERAYWFIDLDRLATHRFLTRSVYFSTVSRACFEFFEELSAEEGKHLIRSCFHAALKRNIFKTPSEERVFEKAAIAQIKQRRHP